MKHFKYFKLLLATLLLASCNSNNHSSELQNYQVEHVQVFGNDVEDIESDHPIEDGVFSNSSNFSVTDDGKVFVYDANYFKIALFDQQGNIIRTLGRHGSGPGEFERVTATAWDSYNDRLAVFDEAQARLTFFNTEGEYLSSYAVPLSMVRSMEIQQDRIWLGRRATRTYLASYIPNPDEETHREGSELDLQNVLELTDEELQKNPEGPSPQIGSGPSGEVLIPAITPGIWYAGINAEFEDVGTALLSDSEMEPIEIEGHTYDAAAGTVLGIGTINDEQLGLTWSYMNRDVQELSKPMLEIFDESGNHVAHAELPSEWTNKVVKAGDNTIYVREAQPYQRIVKYRLIPD